MILVKYGHDGVKCVLKTDYPPANLKLLAATKAAGGWDISWLVPDLEFEATRDDRAAGAIYRLRPDDWPIDNGEPA
jgi:hypothetical protein